MTMETVDVYRSIAQTLFEDSSHIANILCISRDTWTPQAGDTKECCNVYIFELCHLIDMNSAHSTFVLVLRRENVNVRGSQYGREVRNQADLALDCVKGQ